jgi:hypothetical protein
MAVQFSVFCGTDAPHIDAVSCEDLARNLAAEYFPAGHSIRIEDGCWRMQTGEVVNERTVVITWMTENDALANHKVGKMAKQYKDLARQEAVMVVKQEVDSFFI